MDTDMHVNFWRFVNERQLIFMRRLHHEPLPYTHDPILASKRFCNVYRAADRVSQYLIRDVIYAPDALPEYEERCFRAVLFRIFNLPHTYEMLKEVYGEHPSRANWDPAKYGDWLTELAMTQSILNNAYMMCGVPVFGPQYGNEKHRTWLELMNRMLADDLFGKIAVTGTPAKIYDRFHEYPLVSDFLSMQYATDVGYVLPWYDENRFIVPGPGAKRGAAKLGMGATYAINMLWEYQEHGLPKTFPWLGDKRHLSKMDIQNCLCEFDKYARVAYPDAAIGPKTIKQSYRFDRAKPLPPMMFPPYWEL